MKKNYAKSGLWLVSDKLVRAIVNFSTSIFIINYLGKEGYGVFSYTQSMLFVFISISNLGLDSIIVKKVVENEEKAQETLSKCASLKLIAGIIASLVMSILFICQNYNQNEDILYFGVITSISIIFSSLNVFDFYFQSIVKGKNSALAGVGTVFLSAVLKLTFVLSGVPLVYFSFCFVFDYLVIFTILYYFANKKNDINLKFSIDISYFKELLSESWPLLLSAIVVAISMRLDQFAIRSLLSFEDVGLYAASVKISESWLFVPMAIANTYFPSMINAKKYGEKEYLNTMKKIYFIIIYLGVFFALFIYTFGDLLINHIYGDEFNGVSDLLKVHAWTGLFSGLLVVSGKWYINEGLAKLALFRNLFSLGVGLVLNYTLIPLYGLMGAAYSVLIAIICSSLIFDLLGKKTRLQFYLKLKSVIAFRSLQ